MWLKKLWKSRLEVVTLRAIGFWIDLLVLTPVCAVVAWGFTHLIENPGPLSGQSLDSAWWTGLVIYLYRVIFEATRQTSLGKLFTGLTVSPGENHWVSAALRNSWLLLAAAIGFAVALWSNGHNLTAVETLIPWLLGVCILMWSTTPFDVLAKARVEKAPRLLWQDWLKRQA